ncbi:MAG: hypothetical protein AAF628_36975 [Planctomycetota bacterium]
MATSPRVAVVGAEASPLHEQLAGSVHTPTLRHFGDLYAEVDAIQQWHPDAIFAVMTDQQEEDVGALRLLRSLLPNVGMVLLGEAPDEARLRPMAERLHADPLILPAARARVAAALDAALAGGARPSSEGLLDLVRGLSDEINNPLLVTAGHVQLLDSQLHQDETAATLLRVIREGLSRVQTTMDKIRLVTRAINGKSLREDLDLAELTRAAVARVGRDAALELPVEAAPAAAGEAGGTGLADAPGGLRMRGDRPVLEAMVEHLGRAGLELLERDGTLRFELAEDRDTVRVIMHLSRAKVPPWQLPRTFAPYYLNRVLGGTPEGLSLFVVQTAAESHGGRALVRGQREGPVRFEVELARH